MHAEMKVGVPGVDTLKVITLKAQNMQKDAYVVEKESLAFTLIRHRSL